MLHCVVSKTTPIHLRRGWKILIINTDPWHNNRGGKKTLFLWVWWHASLKMTTCKNCLEDPIKYVWNWVFKGGIDRQIHHPIVKCRNTIKVWIFSIVFLDTAQKATDKKKAENMILILHDFHTMQFFLPFFECINYQHCCPIRRISPETVCQFTKKSFLIISQNTVIFDSNPWRTHQQTRANWHWSRLAAVFTCPQLQRLVNLSKVTKTKAHSCQHNPS